eukprot:TRINITY_DN16195_c0_g1_i1.p1 TRINITY_DN16195_c0_g1~~TRINITY_DN16195_c0_g1_i1.p1  ORF type:complete len:102 (+),score=24.30 TRINITY_DN16195_c0_g1_i1:148-453(+)
MNLYSYDPGARLSVVDISFPSLVGLSTTLSRQLEKLPVRRTSFPPYRHVKVVGTSEGSGSFTLTDGTLTTTSSDSREGSFCLLYTSPSPRDRTRSRMPSSA